VIFGKYFDRKEISLKINLLKIAHPNSLLIKYTIEESKTILLSF
jgi:hypothetical protein